MGIGEVENGGELSYASPTEGPQSLGHEDETLNGAYRRPAMARRLLPAIVFLLVATIGIAMAGFAWFAAERSNHFKFESLADDAANRIAARVELNLSMIHSALAYFVAENGAVDREDFRRFVTKLGMVQGAEGGMAGPLLGVQGIGYAPLVPVGGEAAIERRLAHDYGTALSIWPSTDQKLRAPIVLLEPQDARNRAALGYDMYADPQRRLAMTEAIGMATARATHRVQLVQEIDEKKQAGFLVYLPFYAGAPARIGDRETGQRPAGFIYAAFRMGDLVVSALDKAPLLPVTLQVYDGDPADGALLYRSPAPALSGDNYEISRTLDVAGRNWTIRFRPSEAFKPSILQPIAFVLGAVSLLLAATLAALAWSQQRALDAGAALRKAAEKNLVEKDLLLQEMKHRIKNSIARVLAMARQTATGAKSLEDFSNSFAARLQAMATTQDMLTRSAWREADLRALLVEELTPVFGRDLDGDLVSGDSVSLNETATQALGLTFHELATNALKYGALGRGEGRLAVAWHTAIRDGVECLVIEWREEGTPTASPPGRLGFGTRLIDASIRLELGGSIERNYASEGLRIILTIPTRSLAPAAGSRRRALRKE